jgi:ADP-dependent phosphofructokinase/glucokinase
MSKNEIQDDKYKELLEKATQELKSCQEKLQCKSCFDCEKLFDCKIRKNYVNSVYSSMSKGQSGGFEF